MIETTHLLTNGQPANMKRYASIRETTTKESESRTTYIEMKNLTTKKEESYYKITVSESLKVPL